MSIYMQNVSFHCAHNINIKIMLLVVLLILRKMYKVYSFFRPSTDKIVNINPFSQAITVKESMLTYSTSTTIKMNIKVNVVGT